MLKKTLLGGLVLAAATLALPATAGELDDWQLMMSHKMMDANKDGMVSKKEFLEMMGKAYDMKAKEMKAHKEGMSEAELKAFLKALYLGGN